MKCGVCGKEASDLWENGRGCEHCTRTLTRDEVAGLLAAANEKIQVYEAALAVDTEWPLFDVLEVLTGAADHLLLDHDCDAHGYERISAARDAAKRALQKLKR